MLNRTPERRGRASICRSPGSAANGGGRAIGTWLDVIASQTATERWMLSALAPSVACLDLCRSRGPHRSASERLAAGTRRRQLRHRAHRRLGSGKPLAGQGASRAACRGNTIRRSASSPAPTKSSIAATDRRCTPTACPTIASGASSSGSRNCRSATVDDMQQLQYDVLSVQARDLAARAARAAWTMSRSKRSSPPGIAATRPTAPRRRCFQHFYRHVVLQIFGHEQGIGWRRMFYLSTRMGYSTMVLTAIDRTLRKVTSSWWRGRRQAGPRSPGCRVAQKEPVQTWSEFNTFHFVNRFFEGGRAGGCSASVRRPSRCPAATRRRFKAI